MKPNQEDRNNDKPLPHNEDSISNSSLDSQKASNSTDETEEIKIQQTQNEKKMKRVLANRQSARESYKRRKQLFSTLEATISELRNENMKLTEENKVLRREILEFQQRVEQQLGISMIANSQIGSHNIGASTSSGIPSLALQHLTVGQGLRAQQLQLSQQHQFQEQQQQLQLSQQQQLQEQQQQLQFSQQQQLQEQQQHSIQNQKDRHQQLVQYQLTEGASQISQSSMLYQQQQSAQQSIELQHGELDETLLELILREKNPNEKNPNEKTGS